MRGTLSVLLFVAVFFGVIISAHLYIGQRILLDPGWPTPYQDAGLWVLAGLCVTMLLNPFTHRRLPPVLGTLIALPAYAWMGLMFYLLLLTGVADLGLAALGPVSQAGLQQVSFGVAATALLVVTGGLLSVRMGPAVKRVELRLPGWPAALDGYRVVQISDVHIGRLLRRRFAQRVTERVNALSPDLVAITGDLVDGSVEVLRDEVAPFAALRGRDGVYFVTGNHDHYADAAAWCAELERLGLTVLRNRHHSIETAEGALTIAGVDDYSSSKHHGRASDVTVALEGRPPGQPVILLAHNPQSFIDGARNDVTLQLSGHTHGGQLWPFRYLVLLQTRFVAGVHRWRNSTLYVSLGTGFWGPPVRVLAPAEITELVLRPASAA